MGADPLSTEYSDANLHCMSQVLEGMHALQVQGLRKELRDTQALSKTTHPHPEPSASPHTGGVP